MASKKKQQKPKSTAKTTSSSLSSCGLRLQILAENESRLRRLLLNWGWTAQSVAASVDESLSKAQKAKKLKAVYEKLSCEGFTNPQIELALSALKEGATFEASLHWLCLNLPSNELPVKFSSGSSQQIDGGGSVRVLLTSRDDWTPSVDASPKINEDEPGISIKTKGRGNDESLDSCQPSQADWIKRYMEQEEEDESRTWEDDFDDGLTEKVYTLTLLPLRKALLEKLSTGLVTIDGWLKLTAPAQTAVLFKELLSTLHSILRELIKKPENVDVASNKVVTSIIHLLLEEDKPPL